MAPKVTLKDKNQNHSMIIKGSEKKKADPQAHKWWEAGSQKDLTVQLLETASFLKSQQGYRFRQAGINARLYGNMPLLNWSGTSFQKVNMSNQLPVDRPTMNVIQSCTDTLVSRIAQGRPLPTFLTNNGDYKQRNLAKQLNNFIAGEFYQVKAHQKGPLVLRDSAVLGTGVLKVFETQDAKVGVERVLNVELFVDPNEAIYGNPRQLFQVKLVDRSVLKGFYPESKGDISKAQQAYLTPDNGDSSKTVSDQIMVVESWHLPSSKEAGDGRHAIVCETGVLVDEPWEKDKFPFVFMHYNPNILGFWAQSLAEQLMGTQVEINKLLMTSSQAINLMGVPRILVEDGSKVVKAHFNNAIGSIVTYRGTRPDFVVAPCLAPEIYAQLQRLIEYAYSQSGVSALSATSQKPAGLNSGEAIRNYDDLQSDRFAALNKRYNDMYVDLATLIVEQAMEIAERDGKYETIYPGKNGTQTVDLPAAKLLKDNPYVIQCFDASALPKDPAGRIQKVSEMTQAGFISPQEGRRLLDFPDIQQVDKLDNASEERILQILDEIINDGKYTMPDPFMDLSLATKLVTQYYNLYVPANLAPKKEQLLRDFYTQVQALKGIAMTAMPPMQGGVPQASPMPAPQSDLIPNVPGAQGPQG